jgi:hypothetical protein
MPSITLNIRLDSDRHRKILSALRDRHKISKTEMEKLHEKWMRAEEKFLAFLPEKDVDFAKRIKREAGAPQYTTIVLPYTYAMLMTAHTYWTTVFLSRTPVHQYTGRHGESQQQIQALEALIDYQVMQGKMLVPYYIWLLDVGKYGIGITGTYWDEEVAFISNIKKEPELIFGVIPTGRMKKIRRPERIPGYSGNKIFNVRPYNFFPDPRVPLHRFQDGEFCGVYAELGWNTILRRAAQGFYIEDNVNELRNRTRRSADVDQGSAELAVPDIDEHSLDTIQEQVGKKKRLRDANFFGLYEYVVELIPSEWELGRGDMPEKWVFTVDSDFSILIGARPQGAIHNRFPYDVLEFEPEGYGFTNRSLQAVLDPVQRTMDWLVNSHFYSVRKALNFRVIADPSRVVMKDLLHADSHGTVVRLKEGAYGTDIRTVVQELAFNDVTQTHLRDIEARHLFGQRISGINDQEESPRPRCARPPPSASTGSKPRVSSSAQWASPRTAK